MKVPESRLSFFQFPELINKNLQSKLNEAGEQSVEFHVKLGNFTFMVSTYPTSYHSLLDVKENTELIKVIEAYRTLLTALGKDPKTECTRVHNLNLFNAVTEDYSIEQFYDRILNDKRTTMKLSKHFHFPDDVLVGKIKDSEEAYVIHTAVDKSSDFDRWNFRVYGEGSWGPQQKSKLQDLEVLDKVLDNALYLNLE